MMCLFLQDCEVWTLRDDSRTFAHAKKKKKSEMLKNMISDQTNLTAVTLPEIGYESDLDLEHVNIYKVNDDSGLFTLHLAIEIVQMFM